MTLNRISHISSPRKLILFYLNFKLIISLGWRIVVVHSACSKWQRSRDQWKLSLRMVELVEFFVIGLK